MVVLSKTLGSRRGRCLGKNLKDLKDSTDFIGVTYVVTLLEIVSCGKSSMFNRKGDRVIYVYSSTDI